MATTFLTSTPQPGDGAWLLQQNESKRNRGRKKIPSFLRQDAQVTDEVEAAKPGPNRCETFLQVSHQSRQERTSPGLAPDNNNVNVPRTIRNDSLLSREANLQKVSQPQLNSFLCDPVEPSYTFAIPASSSLAKGTSDDAMALPPHLRAKKAPSSKSKPDEGNTAVVDAPPLTNGHHEPAQVATPIVDNGKVQDALTASAVLRPIVDIKKLQNQSCGQGSDSSPAKSTKPTRSTLVAYSSSTQSEKHRANATRQANAVQSLNGNAKSFEPKSSNSERANGSGPEHPSERKGGRSHRGNGRGGFKERPPRASRWPTAAETRPDPRRWDIKWDSSNARSSDIDSVRADSGFGNGKKKRRADGIDEETGFKLTDWDGNWAPAPVDWDARPAFRDSQSAQQIEQWMTGIETDMCGKKWTVSPGPVTSTEGAASPDSMNEGLEACEMAPQYWIPIIIGNQAPQTFWNELMKSDAPEPHDKGDLNGAKPWWEMYQVKGGNFLKPYEHPNVTGIDPDETQNERLARENDHGSNKHTENRKRLEKAKRDAQRDKRKRAQEKARKISESSPAFQAVEKIKPEINLYIRSARPADVARIREIYNHAISFLVCTPELERRTFADMQQRYQDVLANKLPFLVACERGGKIKGRPRKKQEGEDIILPDKVVGFASADDYNDMRGMYRFTAEIEVYTDNHYYMKGVAKCLVDKLMGMLDPEYVERGGYDIQGEELEGVGPSRVIQDIIVNLPYDGPVRLEWTSRWLTEWLSFKQVGDLHGIGNKDRKSVNLAIFQRTTGANIDASKPPITMEYPS